LALLQDRSVKEQDEGRALPCGRPYGKSAAFPEGLKLP